LSVLMVLLSHPQFKRTRGLTIVNFVLISIISDVHSRWPLNVTEPWPSWARRWLRATWLPRSTACGPGSTSQNPNQSVPGRGNVLIFRLINKSHTAYKLSNHAGHRVSFVGHPKRFVHFPQSPELFVCSSIVCATTASRGGEPRYHRFKQANNCFLLKALVSRSALFPRLVAVPHRVCGFQRHRHPVFPPAPVLGESQGHIPSCDATLPPLVFPSGSGS